MLVVRMITHVAIDSLSGDQEQCLRNLKCICRHAHAEPCQSERWDAGNVRILSRAKGNQPGPLELSCQAATEVMTLL